MLMGLGNGSLVVKGQDYLKYYQLVEEASQLYDSNEYLKSGQKYSEAFIALGNKGIYLAHSKGFQLQLIN